jgi:hypothetical protein
MKFINGIAQTPPSNLLNSKNISNKIMINLNKDNLSYSNNYSCNSVKVNKFEKRPKAISINISSIQSPEHKATYQVEGMDSVGLFIKKKQRGLKEVIEELETNSETSLKIKFMKDKYKEKYNKLIDLIVNSDNPWEVVNDIDRIRGIVGDDFTFAQKFLKFIVSVSKTPNSK